MLCPNCGLDNPEGFKFCGSCGMTLEAPVGSSAEERKVISVLFCDLVGFTARSEQADPEDVRTLLRTYHQRLRTEIERFGGTVEKFIGDAVVALFGAPVVHEDDAERAVRSALRILDAIVEMNDSQPEMELAVRIGINTGEAIVSLTARPEEGEGMVAGDVINTASRLQGAAPIGGVVVGEQTHRSTADLFDYTELEPVEVKGKSKPVPIWQATAPLSRYGVETDQRPSTPFVGREDEVEVLKRAYARAVRDPSAQLVTIVGEPGVGKTRLVRELFEFIDEAPELVAWRQGRCLPYGDGITFWALGEIVKAEAGILESDDAERADDKLAAVIERVSEDASEREWLRARVRPLLGLSTGNVADRAEGFAAWMKFLEAIALQNPLVLVIEDLHWADPALLEFLEHVVEYSIGVPLLLICSARPELFERRPQWGGGKRNSATIAVPPLSGTETAQLIQSLLEETVLPAETQAALIERSGGNPLYTEEYVRMLIDRGLLRQEGRAWRLAASEELPLPDSLQALIAARIDTLPPDRKSLLYDAAVMGKVFWEGALATIAGSEREVVGAGLHELALKEMVRPSRTSSIQDQREFAFWHALMRDVAYSQIPRGERIKKHRAAARWIEEVASERLSDHAEILAYHYGQVLDLAKALGTTVDDDVTSSAVRSFVMAGDKAVNLDAARAVDLYASAAGLLPGDDPQRPSVQQAQAKALHELGRFSESRRLLMESIAGHESRGDVVAAMTARSELALTLRDLGETEELERLITLLKGSVDRIDPGPELVDIFLALAGYEFVSGNNHEAIGWAERVLSLAESLGLRAQQQRAHSIRGFSRFEQGDPEGFGELSEALDKALELGLGRETAVIYANLSAAGTNTEGVEWGLALLREGRQFAQQRGLDGEDAWLRGASLGLLFGTGNWDELMQEAKFVRAWAQEHKSVWLEVHQMGPCWVQLFRGDLEAAAADIDALLSTGERTGLSFVRAIALVLKAACRSASGDRARASSILHEPQELVDADAAAASAIGQNRADLVRICLELEERQLAADLMTTLPEAPGANAEYDRLSARAELALAEDRPVEALPMFKEAYERWIEFGVVIEQGFAALGWGRAALALDDWSEAEQGLRLAREIFSRLKARPIVARIDALLEEAIGMSS